MSVIGPVQSRYHEAAVTLSQWTVTEDALYKENVACFCR